MIGKKPKIGDIFEIKTPAGLAYIQYTHEGAGMGQLVRVLPGLFDSRPPDLGELAKQRELYFIFYTLNYAARNRQALAVSHQRLPEWAQPPPLMRWSLNNKAWKIFSASSPLTLEEHRRARVIHNLTPEQKRLSIHQLWPHPTLVKEIARRWTPERAEELRLQDIVEARKRTEKEGSESTTSEPMKHFLYFPKKRDAERAGKELRSRGFSVEVRKGADGENWLALAKKLSPKTGEEMSNLSDEVEALAAQFGGEYDGWEAAVDSPGFGDVEPGQNLN
jgi:regulator of ribonuclease activity B